MFSIRKVMVLAQSIDYKINRVLITIKKKKKEENAIQSL